MYQYKHNDGYYKTSEFFELPLWIAEINGSLTSGYDTELLIIDNVDNAINRLNNSGSDYILFSVLDVNKRYIKDIIKRYTGNGLFCIGGYVDFTYFNGLLVKVFNTVKQFIESLGIEYHYNLDYKLFRGYKTIPRLTLSYGCLNRCKFCTVEKTITEVTIDNILKQVNAFHILDFKLVYINDKTFGQANNYHLLHTLFEMIKSYNKEFKGFIIQTTCIQLLDINFQNMLHSGIIYAVEIGIETFNNDLLYSLDKPQTEDVIIEAIAVLKDNNVHIIPNIIIGIINENRDTYNKTLNLIKQYQEDIYFLNIYNLAVYLDTPLAKDINVLNDNDLNENITNKSFYTEKQMEDNEYFYNEIFKIGIEILNR